MTRLAPLLCLLAAASAEAREPVRVVYRVPAGPPVPSPWTLHPVLSLPTPLMAVSDRDTTDGATTAEFFARLTDAGFAGGWPKGSGVFTVDRIRVGQEGSAALLGGVQVGGHVRGVLGTAGPQQI